MEKSLGITEDSKALLGCGWDLKDQLENIVVAVRSAVLAPEPPCFLPWGASSPAAGESKVQVPLHPPSAAAKTKNHPNGWFSFWLRGGDLNLLTSGL